jgi:DNA-binding transcriptional regulator/RsmH inhibitor MraZ
MKTKSFLYEKGRVYIPTKCRENLGIKGEWFKASRVISKDIGEDVYYKWLTEKTRVYMKEEALGHYKKRGWKNLVIIAKVGTRFWLERQWHFLAIYSPLLHMEVNLAAEVTGRWDLTLVKMENSTVVLLDRTRKITIPKSFRKYAYIDYSIKNKNEYVKKEILLVKKKYVLEVWNPHTWKIAPRVIKGLFNNMTTGIKISGMK